MPDDQTMTAPALTDRILRLGKALVRAIEALGSIEPNDPIERAAGVLLYAYKRRLRGVVEVAPAWVSEQIVSASEHTGDDRAVLWMSDN